MTEKTKTINIYQKLTALQAQLKAPKSQFNKFGKYKYRALEDIMEAVKPLLVTNNLTLVVSDAVVNVGDRFYIEATATLINPENPEEKIQATALAREPLSAKGMSESQNTGTASSYARKYCLNGLFAIDDTKDADSMDNNTKAHQNINAAQVQEITTLLESTKADRVSFLKFAEAETVNDIHQSRFGQLVLTWPFLGAIT